MPSAKGTRSQALNGRATSGTTSSAGQLLCFYDRLHQNLFDRRDRSGRLGEAGSRRCLEAVWDVQTAAPGETGIIAEPPTTGFGKTDSRYHSGTAAITDTK